jgi:anthranilate synthase/aminodeoxychorismate synthase-like glutamine amidotransferase
MILLIDNYDSFTYNLLHYLQNAGLIVTVVRNDNLFPLNIAEYKGIVISPGPCSPAESGQLMDFLEINIHRKPILGVCLGMQAIGLQMGWKLQKAKIPVHGKASLITHNKQGIFAGIKNPMQVGRYHSLIISPTDKSDLIATAHCADEVMAVEKKDGKIFGVQFHPESILTPDGQKIINNWAAIINSDN